MASTAPVQLFTSAVLYYHRRVCVNVCLITRGTVCVVTVRQLCIFIEESATQRRHRLVPVQRDFVCRAN